MTNYVDFDVRLRESGTLRETVLELVSALSGRGLVPVDIGRLWDDHAGGRANHGSALALLASLEVQLGARAPR